MLPLVQSPLKFGADARRLCIVTHLLSVMRWETPLQCELYEAWLFVQLQRDMVVALRALSCTFLWIFLLSSPAILATSSPIANYPPPAQQSTAGRPVSPHVLVPKQGPSCHQKMGDLNLSLTEECAEVFCICPVNPPNSSSSSDSVSLLTSCVPSNTIFTSHISGLFY